ncbi:hypothetical protein M422DRAFT_38186 [Sphaerobolus stellatus SS14]|uniref:Uncharacterized protein n=1 Tax=Sphaerobolus stellatus (strain SS14) TaxID=990650 RepID=A0A0C9TBM9_SPHS4|nr:hypothetical protein M422DRAFT_38186 [Sphaerobolus stellatus SS14]
MEAGGLLHNLHNITPDKNSINPSGGVLQLTKRERDFVFLERSSVEEDREENEGQGSSEDIPAPNHSNESSVSETNSDSTSEEAGFIEILKTFQVQDPEYFFKALKQIISDKGKWIQESSKDSLVSFKQDLFLFQRNTNSRNDHGKLIREYTGKALITMPSRLPVQKNDKGKKRGQNSPISTGGNREEGPNMIEHQKSQPVLTGTSVEGPPFKKRKRKQTSNSQANEDEEIDIDAIADPEAIQTETNPDVQMQDLQSAIDTDLHITAATGQQTSQLNREVTSEFVEKLVSLNFDGIPELIHSGQLTTLNADNYTQALSNNQYEEYVEIIQYLNVAIQLLKESKPDFLSTITKGLPQWETYLSTNDIDEATAIFFCQWLGIVGAVWSKHVEEGDSYSSIIRQVQEKVKNFVENIDTKGLSGVQIPILTKETLSHLEKMWPYYMAWLYFDFPTRLPCVSGEKRTQFEIGKVYSLIRVDPKEINIKYILNVHSLVLNSKITAKLVKKYSHYIRHIGVGKLSKTALWMREMILYRRSSHHLHYWRIRVINSIIPTRLFF